MSFGGDGFKKLGFLIGNLRKLAEVPDEVAHIAAPQITAELKHEYASGTDPYGKAWAPLRPSTLARGRRPPPLDATGKMKDGTEAVAVPGQGIQLTTGHEPIGLFHQTGTSRMASRPVLPYGGMPKKWGAILRDAAVASIRKRVA